MWYATLVNGMGCELETVSAVTKPELIGEITKYILPNMDNGDTIKIEEAN